MEWLQRQRLSGDDSFFSPGEIHKGMKREGTSLSSTSVSRTFINLLCHFKDEIDFKSVGAWYAKRYVLRAKKNQGLHIEDIQRVYNIHEVMDQNKAASSKGNKEERMVSRDG